MPALGPRWNDGGAGAKPLTCFYPRAHRWKRDWHYFAPGVTSFQSASAIHCALSRAGAAQSAAEARGGRVTCRIDCDCCGSIGDRDESGRQGEASREHCAKARLDADLAARRSAENEVQAKKNEREAKVQARIATSRQLAALSASERDKKLDLSLILAVEALQGANTLEAQ